MATKVIMPRAGDGMEEGTVARWLKAEGDAVARGDVLLEIETDKALMDVEAADTGVLRRIVVPEGEVVPVGAVLAVLADEGEEVDLDALLGQPDAPDSSEPATESTPMLGAQRDKVAPSPERPSRRGRVKASPRARKLARETSVDLTAVVGTGPGGRIEEADVQARLESRKSGLQAYIFDFDGVLVDTMQAHYACYKRALEEAGVPIDKERFYYQAGMTGREQIRYFAEQAGVKVDVEAVYERNQELKSAYADRVTSIGENIALLSTLRSVGHPTAIATGSTRRSILPIMERFGIVVDAIATADDIQRGKPHPDLFLKAAEELNTPPERCTVIEDAEVGVQAALAAGMSVMRFHRPEETSSEA